MSKTAGNVVNPLDLVDDFGVDGFRYYVLADTPFGHDGDFTYEGLVARYNADLANNLGNLLRRVATVVGKKCGGIGPRRAPTARSPRPPPTAVRRRPPRRGTASQPSRALDATWRLIRATNAYLEANEPWKAEPGPAVDARAGRRPRGAADRRDPRLAGDPATPPRRSGSASACRARRRPAPARPRRRGAATRAGSPSRRARRSSPAAVTGLSERAGVTRLRWTRQPLPPRTTTGCPAAPTARRRRGPGRRRRRR